MSIINLDDDSSKMYILGYGSKGDKILLDGGYTKEDLLRLIKILEDYINE